MSVIKGRPATPNLPAPAPYYDARNEAQFRRQLELLFEQEVVAPRLVSVDLTFDGSDDKLYLRAVGGQGMQSAKFEIDDDAAFGSPKLSVTVALAEGQVSTQSTTALIAAERDKTWYGRVTPYSGASGSGIVGTPLEDSVFVPSEENEDFNYQETFVRQTSTSFRLTIVVNDLALRSTGVEFNKREGAGAATGWVTSWDTTTGVAGVDGSLTRVEDVTVGLGLESEISWRVGYLDANSDQKYIGNTLNTGNLAANTKTLRLSFSSMAPFDDATTWKFVGPSLYLSANGILGSTFVGTVVLPKGVEIVGFRARMKRTDGTNDLAVVYLNRVNDDGATLTTLATLTHAGTGWITYENTSLSDVVDDEAYLVTVVLDPGALSGNDDCGFLWSEIDYITPSLAVTV